MPLYHEAVNVSMVNSAFMKPMARRHPFIDLTKAGKDGSSMSQPQHLTATEPGTSMTRDRYDSVELWRK